MALETKSFWDTWRQQVQQDQSVFGLKLIKTCGYEAYWIFPKQWLTFHYRKEMIWQIYGVRHICLDREFMFRVPADWDRIRVHDYLIKTKTRPVTPEGDMLAWELFMPE